MSRPDHTVAAGLQTDSVNRLGHGSKSVPESGGPRAAYRPPRAAGGRSHGRFLFVVGEHTGHLHAVLGVARRLSSRGHRVAFLGAGPADAIVAAGFECLSAPWLDSPDEDELFVGPTSARLAAFDQWLGAAEAGAAAVVADFKPDLLLFQPFQLGVYPFFFRHGVPAVSFSTKPLLSYDPQVPPYTCGLQPTPGLLGRLRVRYEWRKTQLRYLHYRAGCMWQQWRYGISHRSALLLAARHTDFPLRSENRTRPLAFDLSFRSVTELVLHAQEFEFPRARPLPPGIAYIGPCLDLARADQYFVPPAGEGPLIYANLGTVGRQMSPLKLALYRHILTAVADSTNWRLVLATGNVAAAETLRQLRAEWPDRIAITAWAPQMAAVAHADLLINHGGANSTKEALWHGVPILALPQHADQPGIAARIAHHGVGLVLDPSAASASNLRTRMTTLLEQTSFRQQANRFKAVFRQYDEHAIAETFIERYAGLETRGTVGTECHLPTTHCQTADAGNRE